MATLNQKIKEYLKNNSKTYEVERKNYVLQNDGSGDYIKSWNVLDLAEPTTDQLENYNDDANKERTNNSIIATRKKSYGSWQDQLDEIYTDIDAWKTRIAKVKSDNPKE